MNEEQATQSVEEVNNEEEETQTPEVETPLTGVQGELFKKMMEVGLFYGRSKSRTNPLMRKNILTTRSGFEVIDLHKTIEDLEEAAKVMEEKAKTGATMLLVGTSPAAKGAIKTLGETLNIPYVTERWLGGTITNFKTITSRVNYFRKLKEDKESGNLGKYTKKEQLQKDKELVKLERLFGGIINLRELPKVVFIADLKENEFPATEARARGITVVAIAGTDSNPKLADYIIPANDRNAEGVQIIIDYIGEAIKKGQAAKPKEVAEVVEKA